MLEREARSFNMQDAEGAVYKNLIRTSDLLDLPPQMVL
jgi:hypothetical protein